jgi:hypothetical protein
MTPFTEIEQLIGTFVREHPEGFTAEEMTAFLVERGINGAEAQLAVSDWETEMNGDARPEDVERLIVEMALPSDSRQLTVGDLKRVSDAYLVASETLIAAGEIANDATRAVQVAMREHGCRVAGELPTDVEKDAYERANAAYVAALRRAQAFDFYLSAGALA